MRRSELARRGDGRPIDQPAEPAEPRPFGTAVRRCAGCGNPLAGDNTADRCPACKRASRYSMVAPLLTGNLAQAQTWAQRTLRGVMHLHPDQCQLLLTTLQVWFQVQGQTTVVARRLGCHPNTVSNRLHRLERLTGWSLADPHGVAELYLAVQAIQVRQPTDESPAAENATKTQTTTVTLAGGEG